MSEYKLGKLPARRDSVKLKLRNYSLTIATPATFGHFNQIKEWDMLANDTVGDCVLAGAGHETILWNAEANRVVAFTDKSVLSDYSAITGYNPNDPNTDQGTDMQAAASYRKKTGVLDSQGKRHKVGAYLAITPGSKTELKQAIYLFSVVGIGIQFPASAMSQFNNNKNWTVTKSKIEGGHYIPAVGYDSKYVYVVTWGKCIKATWGFVAKYMDEGIVYLSPEFLTNGQSLEHFNLTQLQTDLAQLT